MSAPTPALDQRKAEQRNTRLLADEVVSLLATPPMAALRNYLVAHDPSQKLPRQQLEGVIVYGRPVTLEIYKPKTPSVRIRFGKLLGEGRPGIALGGLDVFEKAVERLRALHASAQLPTTVAPGRGSDGGSSDPEAPAKLPSAKNQEHSKLSGVAPAGAAFGIGAEKASVLMEGERSHCSRGSNFINLVEMDASAQGCPGGNLGVVGAFEQKGNSGGGGNDCGEISSTGQEDPAIRALHLKSTKAGIYAIESRGQSALPNGAPAVALPIVGALGRGAEDSGLDGRFPPHDLLGSNPLGDGEVDAAEQAPQVKHMADSHSSTGTYECRAPAVAVVASAFAVIPSTQNREHSKFSNVALLQELRGGASSDDGVGDVTSCLREEARLHHLGAGKPQDFVEASPTCVTGGAESCVPCVPCHHSRSPAHLTADAATQRALEIANAVYEEREWGTLGIRHFTCIFHARAPLVWRIMSALWLLMIGCLCTYGKELAGLILDLFIV